MTVIEKPIQRVTLSLPEEVYATAQEAVSLGMASTPNAFIEEAVQLRTPEVRHARMQKLAEEAMADPDFVADLRETMQAFRHVDKENWPAYDEE